MVECVRSDDDDHDGRLLLAVRDGEERWTLLEATLDGAEGRKDGLVELALCVWCAWWAWVRQNETPQ